MSKPKSPPSQLKINLLGLTLGVDFQDPESWSDEGMGRYDPHISRILINSKMEEGVQRNTLLRELSHVILNHAGLMNLYQNEVLVSVFAAAFTGFIQSNPEIVEAYMYNKPLTKIKQGEW